MKPMPTAAPVPTTRCALCGETVPVGAFCGRCGADMRRPPHAPLAALRPGSFAAAPNESVLAPMISSTLFPQLPRAYRNPFRIGLAVLLAGLVALSLLGWTGPLLVLTVLGLPALFVLYLRESDMFSDVPRHVLALSAVLGTVFGVAGEWFAGMQVARAYFVPVTVGFLLFKLDYVGLEVAARGVAFMVAPVLLVRFLLRHRDRESLDGFVIGALGAVSSVFAGTTVNLAAQYVAGLLGHDSPLRRLSETVVFGVAAPITAAAFGGLFGILLWFRPGRRAAEHPKLIRALLVGFTAVSLLSYLAIWLIDLSPLTRWPQLALHLLVTLVAIVVTRICLQMALLHEAPDGRSDLPVLCLNCERVVPEMPFCPACGFASRALSRSTRRQRRENPPIRR